MKFVSSGIRISVLELTKAYFMPFVNRCDSDVLEPGGATAMAKSSLGPFLAIEMSFDQCDELTSIRHSLGH